MPGSDRGVVKRSRQRKRHPAGIARSIAFGTPYDKLEVPDKMTEIAERRGMERFHEGLNMEFNLKTIVAAIYLQGVMDAADSMEAESDE